MSESKIQIKVGIVEFSGEGNSDWLSTQLDKILEKVPELLKIELQNSEPNNGTKSTSNSPMQETIVNPEAPKNLPHFLKDKNATTNQVQKFLATATFIQLNGKKRWTTAIIAKMLKDSNQNRLGNPSDCLSQNIKKGFCEKDGSEYFVTSEGLNHLSIKS